MLIGHCLRFWPQYVRAQQLIESGELGTVIYARFFRAGGAPSWSAWLMDGAQSGGAVLDMHVHDVDTALWWFGRPASIQTSGLIYQGLPLKVDAAWSYDGGPEVHIHGGWDKNSGHFAMGFEIVGTQASLYWDSSKGDAMQLAREGQSRQKSRSATNRRIKRKLIIFSTASPKRHAAHAHHARRQPFERGNGARRIAADGLYRLKPRLQVLAKYLQAALASRL